MARNYRRKHKEDSFAELVSGLLGLYALYLFARWYLGDKEAFWDGVIYGLIVTAVIIAGTFAWIKIKGKAKQDKEDHIVSVIKEAGLEDYINNFISRFGVGQKKNKNAWTRRGYTIDWARMDDLRDFLTQKNIRFSTSDISILLAYYIEEKEHKLTFDSIQVTTQSFSDLNGTDFERLLYRLYEKMGYSVQHNGGAGDQGGDLIVTKGQERTLIQAKRYSSPLDNKPVQEAATARIYYNCNRASVVTNSSFTNGGKDAAKMTNVQLIEGEELKKMLQEYLKESWA